MTVDSQEGTRRSAPDAVTGYLSASGNRIVDRATGEAVSLVGANWFGAEAKSGIPNGLWTRNYKDMMDEMAQSGVNVLRMPISPEILDGAIVTESLRRDINPDLAGKTALEIMDAIVDYAGQIGIRIILDMHRRTPGVGKQEDGLWFSDDYSVNDLARDWKTIAAHYADNPTVIGADVFNEPSGKARWGDEASSADLDWAAAAETLGNAILEANPDLLILVQGVHIVDGRWYWVGGNLKGAQERPIELDLDGRLVYSVHDYPRSVRDVPWLKGATPEEMVENFRQHWGYLLEEGTAPVLIGETGARMESAEDAAYLDALFGYLEDLGEEHGANPGVTWWGWNPNSHDTGGLLDDDWRTLHADKLAYLDRIDHEALPATEAALEALRGEARTLVLEADDARAHTRVFAYEISGGTATEGEDFAARDGVIQLDPGETRAEIGVTLLPGAVMDGPESVVVTIRWSNGAVHSRHELALEPPRGVEATPEPAPAPKPAAPPKVVVADDDEDVATLTLVDDDDTLVACVRTMTSERVHFTMHDEGLRPEASVVVSLPPSPGLGFGPDGPADGRLIFDGAARAGGAGSGFTVSVEDAARFGETPTLRWDASVLGLGSGRSAAGAGAAAGPIEVGFEIAERWGDAFLGRVSVTNAGEADMTDWLLGLDSFDFDLAEAHKVRVDAEASRDEGRMVVRAPQWDDTLEPGETFVFGVDGVMRDDAIDLDLTAVARAIDFDLI